MSEYVCDLIGDYPGIEFGDEEYSGTCERREKVVRCSGCVHFRPPNKTDPARCDGVFAFVEPDPAGFCAWGKRRDES